MSTDVPGDYYSPTDDYNRTKGNFCGLKMRISVRQLLFPSPPRGSCFVFVGEKWLKKIARRSRWKARVEGRCIVRAINERLARVHVSVTRVSLKEVTLFHYAHDLRKTFCYAAGKSCLWQFNWSLVRREIYIWIDRGTPCETTVEMLDECFWRLSKLPVFGLGFEERL